MVKIRLAQFGAKNRRTYRIVAIEEGKKREGKPIEILGFYNPLVSPHQFKVNRGRLAYWRSQGAQISDGVIKLLKTSV